MIHKIFSAIGLGILGIDPITAVYLLSMGLRREKKIKISLFFLSFAGFSIFIGAALAVLLGAAAVDFLQTITPGDSSPVWAILEFIISVFIMAWVFKKIFIDRKKTENQSEKTISGNRFKYIATGFVFAISSFTDPTYYAVILMGGESNNILTAAILLTVWFLVSQCFATLVYIANQCNLLNKLVNHMDNVKHKNLKAVKYLFYFVLIVIAILLITDTGFYLFNGRYLF